MTYLNEFHRISTEKKMKAIEEMQKSPIGCIEAVRQARLNITGQNFSRQSSEGQA